ncbi:MAG: hypothetical protein OXE50_02865 [Chloroflexi bacterium]|nr:hypothetical protein [Chloroflexota bacterium]
MSGIAQLQTGPQPTESGTEEREMSGNERFFPEELSDRQVTALPYLAAAPTKQEGARMAEINVSTLRRWQQDPVFRDELRRIREETASLAFAELNGLALKSMSALAGLIEDDNPRIRAQAVRIALSTCARHGETARNTRRLNQLQKTLTLLKNVK